MFLIISEIYLFLYRTHVKINKALAFLQSEIDDWLKNKSHKTQDDLMEEARRFVESKKIIR